MEVRLLLYCRTTGSDIPLRKLYFQVHCELSYKTSFMPVVKLDPEEIANWQ